MEIATGKSLMTFRFTGTVSAILLSEECKRLFVAVNRDLFVWDISKNEQTLSVRGCWGGITAFALQGLVLWASCQDGTLCCFDIYTGECKRLTGIHGHMISALGVNSDNNTLIAATNKDRAFAWDIDHQILVDQLFCMTKICEQLR